MNAETVAETQQPDVLTLELVTMMQQLLVTTAHVNTLLKDSIVKEHAT
ncbi:MAG: hypothetical protein ACJAYM_001009 [Flavobacteriales bacterium]|jgi:hypothetical protein